MWLLGTVDLVLGAGVLLEGMEVLDIRSSLGSQKRLTAIRAYQGTIWAAFSGSADWRSSRTAGRYGHDGFADRWGRIVERK